MEEEDKIQIFNDEEIQIIKDSVTINFSDFIYYFALATGMRKGEMLALTINDIDLINDSIHINKTTKNVKVFKNEVGKRETLIYTPKTQNSIRTIPLPLQIKELTVKQIEQQKEKNLELLFTNRNNTIIDGDVLTDTYKTFLKRNNIPYRKFHTLRHTYCSILAINNVPILLASKLLGNTVEMVEKVYTHIDITHKKNAIKNITF